jgi:ABC-type branched-subunit amino acid transport system substrate-binding protein
MFTIMNRRSAIAMTAAIVIATALSSCSSSKTAKSDAGSTAAAGSGGGSSASGTPILIGSEASITSSVYSSPQARDGILAAVASINAAGGVGGRPLKLDFCDTAYTVNGELSCTRKLIADKVAALIAPNILADTSGAEYTMVANAKIPVIGTEGLSPAELSSPVVFPLSSGIPGWVYGAVANLVSAGSTKISVISDTNPASQFFGMLTQSALKLAGLNAVNVVTADFTADPTGATAAAKAISNGTNGIVISDAPQTIPKMLTSLKGAGYSGKIASFTALFAPALIKAAGAEADGVLLTSQLALVSDTSNPGIVKFLADMKTYESSSVVDETTEFSWAATELFAKVAGAAKATDAGSVLAALNGLSSPVDIQVAAPFSVVGKTSPLSSFPRIVNPTVQDGVLKNGVLTPNGKGFTNPFTTSW